MLWEDGSRANKGAGIDRNKTYVPTATDSKCMLAEHDRQQRCWALVGAANGRQPPPTMSQGLTRSRAQNHRQQCGRSASNRATQLGTRQCCVSNQAKFSLKLRTSWLHSCGRETKLTSSAPALCLAPSGAAGPRSPEPRRCARPKRASARLEGPSAAASRQLFDAAAMHLC
jgi:hypothetical protein